MAEAGGDVRHLIPNLQRFTNVHDVIRKELNGQNVLYFLAKSENKTDSFLRLCFQT